MTSQRTVKGPPSLAMNGLKDSNVITKVVQGLRSPEIVPLLIPAEKALVLFHAQIIATIIQFYVNSPHPWDSERVWAWTRGRLVTTERRPSMEGGRGSGSYGPLEPNGGMPLSLPENESDDGNNKRLLSPPPDSSVGDVTPLGVLMQAVGGVEFMANGLDTNTVTPMAPAVADTAGVTVTAEPDIEAVVGVESEAEASLDDETPAHMLIKVAEKLFHNFSLADLLFFKATNYTQYKHTNGFDLILKETEDLLEDIQGLMADLLIPGEDGDSDLELSSKMEQALGLDRHWLRKSGLELGKNSDLNTLLPETLEGVEIKREYNVSTFLDYHSQNLKESCGLHHLDPALLSRATTSEVEAKIKQERLENKGNPKNCAMVPLALCQKCGKQIQEEGDVFDQDFTVTPDLYADDFFGDDVYRKKPRKRGTKRKRRIKYDDDFIDDAPMSDDSSSRLTPGGNAIPSVKADPDANPDTASGGMIPNAMLQGAIDAVLDSKDHVKRAKHKRKPKQELSNEGDYWCRRCKDSFKDELVFARHETICNPQNVPIPKYEKLGENQFQCKFRLCNSNQVFPSLFSLRKHFFSTHVSEEDLKFPCEYCGQRFARGGALNDHITSKHKKNHTCEECGKAFNAPNRLREHMLTHTGAKPFACDLCDHRCARSNALKRHKELVHKKFEIGNYFCDICGRSFNQERILRRHINQTHENPKEEIVHNCQRCDYVADNKSHLTQHMTIHHSDTADDQYPCDQCNKAFRIEKYLKYHKKYVHSGKTRNKRSGSGSRGVNSGNSGDEMGPEDHHSVDDGGVGGGIVQPQHPPVGGGMPPVQLLIPNPPDHHSTASNSTTTSPGPTPTPLQQQRFMGHLHYPPYSFNLN
eukprot:snap_masked-scaffold42_size484952-processed-gene-3.20 protein:Tk06375 transcript:snap_masked-scaffold42_size484952-processed-gene-3.20-mRNA-1 annotation:"zinc finger x-chromosomal protein"